MLYILAFYVWFALYTRSVSKTLFCVLMYRYKEIKVAFFKTYYGRWNLTFQALKMIDETERLNNCALSTALLSVFVEKLLFPTQLRSIVHCSMTHLESKQIYMSPFPSVSATLCKRNQHVNNRIQNRTKNKNLWCRLVFILVKLSKLLKWFDYFFSCTLLLNLRFIAC